MDEYDDEAVEREVEWLLREQGWSEEELERRRERARQRREGREELIAAAPAPPPLDLSPEGMLLAARAAAIPMPWNMTAKELRKHPDVRAVLDAGGELRREAILSLSAQILAPEGESFALLLATVARSNAPLTLADVAWLVAAAAYSEARGEHTAERTFVALARQLQWLRDRLDRRGRAQLAPLVERAATFCHHKQNRDRIRAIAPTVGDPIDRIDTRDDVGPRLRALLRASPELPDAVRSLVALLDRFPTGSRPSKAWQAQAAEARAALDDPSALVTGLLGAALDAGDSMVGRGATGAGYGWRQQALFAEDNERWFRGAVYFAGLLGDPAHLVDLRRLTAKAIAPTAYPRSLKVANASVEAIARIGTRDAVAQLLLLERTTGHGTLLREIRKALDGLAVTEGVNSSELLERGVELHGLDADGTLSVSLSVGSGVVRIHGTDVTLSFVDADGVERTRFPYLVGRDHEALAALRRRVRAIRATIASERDRLDALLVERRTWPLDDWAALYLHHPITGRLTRLLVWRFDDVVGMPVDAATACDATGETVAIPERATVGLWHPAESEPAEIRAWRARLLATTTAQPVRQAFLLTGDDAPDDPELAAASRNGWL